MTDSRDHEVADVVRQLRAAGLRASETAAVLGHAFALAHGVRLGGPAQSRYEALIATLRLDLEVLRAGAAESRSDP